jgi:hypothetical protein
MCQVPAFTILGLECLFRLSIAKYHTWAADARTLHDRLELYAEMTQTVDMNLGGHRSRPSVYLLRTHNRDISGMVLRAGFSIQQSKIQNAHHQVHGTVPSNLSPHAFLQARVINVSYSPMHMNL